MKTLQRWTNRTFTVYVVSIFLTTVLVTLPLWVPSSEYQLSTFAELMTEVYVFVIGAAVAGAGAAKTAQRAKAGNPPESTG